MRMSFSPRLLVKGTSGSTMNSLLIGVETQRQWSDNAIKRTIPLLMVLYSILIAIKMNKVKSLVAHKTTIWYNYYYNISLFLEGLICYGY